MTKKVLLITLIGVLTFTNYRCSNQLYIDTDYPNTIPKLFADSIFSKHGFVRCLFVSSDKKEYYFHSSHEYQWSSRYLKRLTLANNSDGYVVDTVVDAKNEEHINRCTEPWLTQDNNELYFTADHDIWKMVRENNKWVKPFKLDSAINSSWKEGRPSLSKNKTLYFHSFEKNVYKNNIYYSRFVDGKFTKRIKIDKLGEDGDAGDPAIAPDESFIVFASSRETSFGECDLYISFNEKGQWTTPQNLGSEINSPGIELGPVISNDGKFLFYYQLDKWKNAEYSKVYWVDIQKVIKRMKDK